VGSGSALDLLLLSCALPFSVGCDDDDVYQRTRRQRRRWHL